MVQPCPECRRGLFHSQCSGPVPWSVLKRFRAAAGIQWRERRNCVVWENLGRVKTSWAAGFCMSRAKGGNSWWEWCSRPEGAQRCLDPLLSSRLQAAIPLKHIYHFVTNSTYSVGSILELFNSSLIIPGVDINVLSLSRAENDDAIIQPNYSGSVAQCCVLVLHAGGGVGFLCPWPHRSHMHHQLEEQWCVSFTTLHNVLSTLPMTFFF